MLSTARFEENVASAGPMHQSVLLEETVRYLRPEPGSVLVDATLGAGGHAEALLRGVGSEGRVYGIERDPEMLEAARRRLAEFGNRFVPVRGDHRNLANLLHEVGRFAVDGIVADLGISSLQLDDPLRGFSFRGNGPLDMRMDRSSGTTAADLLASLSEEELRRILREYGEERRATAIARAIVRERAHRPIRTTRGLAELVERVAGPAARKYRIHPATRTFQALRIAVNGEVGYLPEMIRQAASLLRRGGRLVMISFHSLEDRAVKITLRDLAHRCVCPPGLPVCGCGRENLLRVLTSKAVRPEPEEVDRNPRSRSARLRAAERL